MGDDIAIGIDLGTTNCCVAVYHNKEVIVIPNENFDGSKTTPSYVEFNENGVVTVGQIAKDNAFRNLETTVYDAKRIIGRDFTDPILQRDMALWPFKVRRHEGVPKIEIRERYYHPEEISARLLMEMKGISEDYLQLDRGTIKKAVVTVPAYFNDGQRQATMDAGKLAGLDVLLILNEPTAAAIAYLHKRLDTKAKNVMIFDFGGGTLDVALIEVEQDSMTVLGIHGDTHLGGEDFDKNMMIYCVQKFKAKTGIDLMEGVNARLQQTRDEAKKNLRRLQQTCERQKRRCAKGRTATVVIEAIVNGKDLCVELNKQTFEQINEDLYKRCIRVIDEALVGAGVVKEWVDDIILIGGSTRMNKIRNLLEEYFEKTNLNISINPDEAVAYGAALQAALLTGKKVHNFNVKEIRDVTGMSLGIENRNKTFEVIIPKNSPIPVRKSQRRIAVEDDQMSTSIKVFQGDEKIAANNKLLGMFTLRGFYPVDKGECMCSVEMEINRNGILNVTAVSMDAQQRSNLTVVADNHRMSQETIERLLREMRM